MTGMILMLGDCMYVCTDPEEKWEVMYGYNPVRWIKSNEEVEARLLMQAMRDNHN